MSASIANQQEAPGYGHTVDCSVLDQHVFQRVMKDVDVEFGDGGYVDLSFPVLVCPSLPVGETAATQQGFLKELDREMDRLATMRKDVQQNGVVEDIIDPELFPRLIPAHERHHAPASKPRDTMRAALMNTDNRGSYTWIPTKVAYNTKSGAATLLGPIQNLPRTPANERLYTLLERCLTQVMPSLHAQSEKKRKPPTFVFSGDKMPLSVFASKQSEENPDVQLCNVSIKLLRYRMPPHSSYKGMWHTEGVTEGVASAAVLYVDWPEELQGGALKFRPPSVPDSSYRENMYPSWSFSRNTEADGDTALPEHPKLSLSVPGRSGSSVVFANTIPHRFETLQNITEKTLIRSFVNFFLTDPNLPDTNLVPTNADVYLALVGCTNYDIVGEVLQWLGNTPLTIKDAKALRARSKAEMVDKRSKWGEIMYGNCGQLEFLPTGGPTEVEQKRINELRDEDENNGVFNDDQELSSNRAKKEGIDHSYTTWWWNEMDVKTHDDGTSSGGKSLLTAGN